MTTAICWSAPSLPHAEPMVLDEQDRIAILQMLELTPSQRVAYLVDEVEFDLAVGPASGDD